MNIHTPLKFNMDTPKFTIFRWSYLFQSSLFLSIYLQISRYGFSFPTEKMSGLESEFLITYTWQKGPRNSKITYTWKGGKLHHLDSWGVPEPKRVPLEPGAGFQQSLLWHFRRLTKHWSCNGPESHMFFTA